MLLVAAVKAALLKRQNPPERVKWLIWYLNELEHPFKPIALPLWQLFSYIVLKALDTVT